MEAEVAPLCFAAAFAGSLLSGCGVRRWLLARQVWDLPNARSSHRQATVRGGGLAIVFIIVVGLGAVAVFQSSAVAAKLILPLLILAGISFWDDLGSVPVRARLLAHLGVALIGLWVLGCPAIHLELTPTLAGDVPLWLGAGMVVVWLTGFPNAFNFMDGIDGHAPFQVVITAGATAVIGGMASGRWTAPPVLVSAVVAGAAAGFLPFNFPRARMFMGDVGSVPLGYLLAFLVLWQAQVYSWQLLIPLSLLHLNFLFDAGVTLCRRILMRERWSEPHREHFYERMAQAMKSHARVTIQEMAVQLVAVVLLVLYVTVGCRWKLALAAGVILLWSCYFTTCELYCRRRGFGFRAARPLITANQT